MGIGMFSTSLLLAVACVPDGQTVQALVDARAEQLAADARMSTRLAVASGGLSAQIAPLTLEEWTALETLEAGAEVAEILGITEPASVQANKETGAIRISWADVEFTPEIHGRVDIDVLRPQTQFTMGFAQNPGEAPGVYADADVTVVSESMGAPELRVVFDQRVGATTQRVEMPAPALAEDTGGAASEPVWAEGGAFLPLSGDFRWSRTSAGKAQELRSLTVEEIEDMEWPVVAASEDWEHVVSVDLSRDLDQ